MVRQATKQESKEVSMFMKNIFFYSFYFFLLLIIASFGLIAES